MLNKITTLIALGLSVNGVRIRSQKDKFTGPIREDCDDYDTVAKECRLFKD